MSQSSENFSIMLPRPENLLQKQLTYQTTRAYYGTHHKKNRWLGYRTQNPLSVSTHPEDSTLVSEDPHYLALCLEQLCALQTLTCLHTNNETSST